MRAPSKTLRVAAIGLSAVALVGAVAACGTKPTASVQTSGTTSGANTQVCGPVPGKTLVTLADDKHLELSDNLVPLVRTAVAKAPLTTALNMVSTTLTQPKLIALNTAVSVNHESSQEAAKSFVSDNGLGSGFSGGSGPIRIIAAGFTENQTLAYIYADVLTAAGYTTSVKVSTNRELYLPLVEKGSYDLVPEYAATVTEFLSQEEDGQAATDPASTDITKTIAALMPLAAKKGLTPLTPSVATDQDAFAVTSAFAQQYKVTTLSELASTCGGGVSLGGTPECQSRQFCELGLKSLYGLKITKFQQTDEDGQTTRSAVEQGAVALVEVFSSDSDVKPAS